MLDGTLNNTEYRKLLVIAVTFPHGVRSWCISSSVDVTSRGTDRVHFNWFLEMNTGESWKLHSAVQYVVINVLSVSEGGTMDEDCCKHECRNISLF